MARTGDASRTPEQLQARLRIEIGAGPVTEGRRLFRADLEADLRYVRDVQLRAADLRPFLERTQRIKLEALRR